MKSPGTVRTLLIDVESTPNLAYVWGKWEQNVVGDFVQERQIISVAWKWLDEKETHVASLPMFKSYKKNPLDNWELVGKLHHIISQADIVIGHNLIQFDDKMANTDFIVNGFPPPPPHKTVDTLRVAKSKFAFNSNKLGDLGKRLGLGSKVQTGGFSLWVGCMRGDPESWKLMEKYNKQDVVLLEKIYLKLRPWMTNHPVVSDFTKRQCPACGSFKVQSRGSSKSSVRVHKTRYRCECGRWFSAKWRK